MHPVRRHILFRWIGYALVIVGMGTWIYMQDYQEPRFPTIIVAPKKIELPQEEVTKSIKSAISVLRGEKAAYASVENIDKGLIRTQFNALDGDRPGGGMPSVKVSAIFLGPPDKFAILNGVVYKQGAMLPDGRVLKDIGRDQVVLAMGESEQTVPWIHPFRVELTKAEVKPGQPAPAEAAPAAEAAGVGATGEQQVDVNNLPPDLSPDQALEILQQMGKQ